MGVRRRRLVSRNIAPRLAADTPTVVVGMPGDRPQEFYRLPIIRYVVAGEGSARYQITLDEVATTVGVVCDDGLIVVDSSGIRTVDLSGRISGTYALPFPRRKINATDRSDVLDRAVGIIRDADQRARARQLLEQQLQSVQSAFSAPTIDVTGGLWFSVPHRPRTKARTDIEGRISSVVQLEHVGFALHITRTQISMVIAGSDLSDPIVEVNHLGSAINGDLGPLGWCHAPFRP